MIYAEKKRLRVRHFFCIFIWVSCKSVGDSISPPSPAFLSDSASFPLLPLKFQIKYMRVENRHAAESDPSQCSIPFPGKLVRNRFEMHRARRSRKVSEQAVPDEHLEKRKQSVLLDLTNEELENESQADGKSFKKTQKLCGVDPTLSPVKNSKGSKIAHKDDTFDRAIQEIASIWDDNFHLLCWNLDGLDERFLKLRTDYVIETLKKLKPGVVFLQEVINLSLDLLRHKLSNDYQFILPKDTCGLQLPYFCVILLAYEQILCYEGSEFTHWYPRTRMGRHLLTVCARPLNRPDECIQLSTTHLESTWQFARERKLQFKQALEYITCKENHRNLNVSTSIFGGDLNIIDSELVDIDFHEDIEDVWKALGSPKDCQFTWDLTLNSNIESSAKRKPRRRFDRIYCYNPPCDSRNGTQSAATWKPIDVKLIGTEPISSCELFPSDHFGLLFKFKRIES